MRPRPPTVALGDERGAAGLDRAVVHVQLNGVDPHVVVSGARADFQQVPSYGAHHVTSVASSPSPSATWVTTTCQLPEKRAGIGSHGRQASGAFSSPSPRTRGPSRGGAALRAHRLLYR